MSKLFILVKDPASSTLDGKLNATHLHLVCDDPDVCVRVCMVEDMLGENVSAVLVKECENHN